VWFVYHQEVVVAINSHNHLLAADNSYNHNHNHNSKYLLAAGPFLICKEHQVMAIFNKLLMVINNRLAEVIAIFNKLLLVINNRLVQVIQVIIVEQLLLAVATVLLVPAMVLLPLVMVQVVLVTVLQALVTVLQVVVTAQLLLVMAQLLLVTVLLALVMVPPLVVVQHKHPSFLALVVRVIQLKYCHHWVVILLSVSMLEHSAFEQ
jgi:hypothetical protein